MSAAARFTLWLRALFTRRRVEWEMAREMQSHLEMATEHHMRLGVPRDTARPATSLASHWSN